LRGVRKALDHEIARQGARLAGGTAVAAETRGWDARRGATVFQRAKERSSDYRYFPEPDLPALVVDEAMLASIRRELPELPAARELRYVRELGLAGDVAATLCESSALAVYFEAMAETVDDARACANWVTGEVLRLCGETGVDVAEFPVPPDEAAALLRRVARGGLSLCAAKAAFATMVAEGATAADAIARAGMGLIGDREHLSSVIARVIATYPEQAALCRAGKAGVADWLTGRVMAATGGRADPRLTAEILRAALMRPDDG
ncbi:Asp-tRNA(Asn)/Glu-tRNA(Gln) amidotransferase GatCAB subunit B, partial [bacterium]|nr:Asp-tRNA(Asn)/Glu-tRNA(Gln) amidotransferase GatCAB subunit B [bacterium]